MWQSWLIETTCLTQRANTLAKPREHWRRHCERANECHARLVHRFLAAVHRGGAIPVREGWKCVSDAGGIEYHDIICLVIV